MEISSLKNQARGIRAGHGSGVKPKAAAAITPALGRAVPDPRAGAEQRQQLTGVVPGGAESGPTPVTVDRTDARSNSCRREPDRAGPSPRYRHPGRTGVRGPFRGGTARSVMSTAGAGGSGILHNISCATQHQRKSGGLMVADARVNKVPVAGKSAVAVNHQRRTVDRHQQRLDPVQQNVQVPTFGRRNQHRRLGALSGTRHLSGIVVLGPQ